VVYPVTIVVSGKFVIPAAEIGAGCRHSGTQPERLEEAVFTQTHQNCLGFFKLSLLQARGELNIPVAEFAE
jgi:hypothetical protein